MKCKFKALSDTTRCEILNLLNQGNLTAGEIVAHFSLSWPSISHHLSILKDAGFIIQTKDGQNIIYSMNANGVNEILSWLTTFKKSGNKNRNSKGV